MLYTVFKKIFYLLFRIFNRYTVIGSENFPKSGPVIFVGNHASYWDPMAMGCAIQRQVRFIGKEIIFKIPVVGFFVRAWGGIPLKQERINRTALETAFKILKNGEVFGIFIEGTRNLKNPKKLLKPHPGAAMLAIRSGAPVVPVTLINTRKILWSFQRVIVVIGAPLYFHPGLSVERRMLYAGISAEIIRQIELPLHKYLK